MQQEARKAAGMQQKRHGARQELGRGRAAAGMQQQMLTVIRENAAGTQQKQQGAQQEHSKKPAGQKQESKRR